MTVEDAISELLAASVDITALVSDRIFEPSGQQSETRPYIVHFAVSEDPQYVHAQPGQSGLIHPSAWRYQVSSFADTFAEARALSQKVVAAIEGTRAAGSPAQWFDVFYRGFTILREDDPAMFQVASDFDIFASLT